MKWFTKLKDVVVPPEIEQLVDSMPHNLGSMGYDPWGYNPETAKVGLTVLKWMYDHYFRVEATGLENVPTNGRAFVIGNHSGQLPMDGTLIGTALATNPDGPRIPRAMIERFFPTVPFVYTFMTQCGATIGDPVNCIKMLENEEVVIVFPEGVRGSGKLYKERYELKRMGTGFVRIAIQTNSPIIPVGVVGCEETMPSFGNFKSLAKLIGTPYFPIAIPVILPAKVFLNFGEPIHLEGDPDNETQMMEKVDEVKEVLQELIDLGLEQRGERIFG